MLLNDVRFITLHSDKMFHCMGVYCSQLGDLLRGSLHVTELCINASLNIYVWLSGYQCQILQETCWPKFTMNRCSK